jgi:hypothetical protein
LKLFIENFLSLGQKKMPLALKMPGRLASLPDLRLLLKRTYTRLSPPKELEKAAGQESWPRELAKTAARRA